MASPFDFVTTQISFLVSTTSSIWLLRQDTGTARSHPAVKPVLQLQATMLTLEWVFKPDRLSLIHIPISLYPFFVQPIFRVLFGDDNHHDAVDLSWTKRHHFLNISITPVECSIFCSVKLADQYFRPLIDGFNGIVASGKSKTSRVPVEISAEDFVVIEVAGQGPEAGQRVVDLTSPLAMAGMYEGNSICATKKILTRYYQTHLLRDNLLLGLYPSPSQSTQNCRPSPRAARLRLLKTSRRLRVPTLTFLPHPPPPHPQPVLLLKQRPLANLSRSSNPTRPNRPRTPNPHLREAESPQHHSTRRADNPPHPLRRAQAR